MVRINSGPGDRRLRLRLLGTAGDQQFTELYTLFYIHTFCIVVYCIHVLVTANCIVMTTSFNISSLSWCLIITSTASLVRALCHSYHASWEECRFPTELYLTHTDRSPTMHTVVSTALSQYYRLEMLMSVLTLQYIIEVLISYKLKGVVNHSQNC